MADLDNGNKAGDTPVEFMLEILFQMIESFIQGVKAGYKENNGQASPERVQELQQMTETINRMMQTITQMMQTQRMMQAGQIMQSGQALQAGQQVIQPGQEIQPGQAMQPGQGQQKPEQAVAEEKQAGAEPLQQKEQPAQGKAEAGPEEKQPGAESAQKDEGAAKENTEAKKGESEREQAQQGQKKPVHISEAVRLLKKRAQKTGGCKWFSDTEMERIIAALNNMKDSEGRLSPEADRFLKSMTELKETISSKPGGTYAALYVKAYDAARDFKQEAAKNDPENQKTGEAAAMAEIVTKRLEENERIYTLRNVLPAAERMAKKEARQSESGRVEIEKQKAEERAKNERMNDKAGKNAEKSGERRKMRTVKRHPLENNVKVM